MIIIALVVFIWGVAGMKIYGNVCSRATHEYDSNEGKMMPSSSSAKFVSGCEVINVRASFESITKAMRLMFELATNQDASPVIRDIKANTDSSSWVTPFFATFYVVSNFILLNLFVAATQRLSRRLSLTRNVTRNFPLSPFLPLFIVYPLHYLIQLI